MSAKRGRPRKERYALLMGGLWKNPKIRRLSNEALGVLVRAWSYAASEMTDGRVPLELMEAWAKPKRWPAVRKELTSRHPASDASRGEPLLRIADGAIDAECHDFTDVNISAAEYERSLEADRKRKDFPGGNEPDFPTGNATGNAPTFQPDPPTRTRTIDEDPSLRSGGVAHAREATPPPRPVVEHPGIAAIAERVWQAGLVSRGSHPVMRAADAPHFRAVGEAADALRGEEPLRAVLERWFAEWVATRRNGRLRPEWWAEWAVERAAAGAGVTSGWAPPRPAGSYGVTSHEELERMLGPVTDEDLERIERGRGVHG